VNVGVDFILRASSAQFTKAMASANNSIKDLKKGLKEFDVGNGLKQALGVGGVIAGFRAVISHARDVRDEFEKMGKPVDSATRSVAEFGDAIVSVSKFAEDTGVKVLSIFTKVGDGIRQIVQNTSQAEEDALRKMVTETGKAADEQEKKLKASKEANSPEKQQAAQEKLDKAKRESAAKGTDDEKKLVNLLNEQVELREKMQKVGAATVEHKELETKLIESEAAARDLNQKMADKQGQKELRLAEQQDKEYAEKQKDIREKFAPSVEQLGQMDVGTGVSQNDPRLVARRILEKEKFAAEAGSRGDIAGAMKLGTEAQSMRDSLSKVSGSGTALTAETAESALRNALESTNKELEGVREQLKGLIKAQK
jgi:hypothetical protein